MFKREVEQKDLEKRIKRMFLKRKDLENIEKQAVKKEKDQELKSILKTSSECKLTNKNLRVRFARGRPRISKIII